MIQRRQTIFLVIIVILYAVLFFIPVYSITISVNNESLISYRSLTKLGLLMINLSVVALIALASVFMFRNRKRQLAMVNAGLLLSLALFVLCIAFRGVFSGASVMTTGNPVADYSMGIYLIGIIPALFFFAGRYIRKDENLVKAADRLR